MSSTETKKAWAHYTEPSFVDVDGLSVAYRRKGDGERVLFLHGEGLTRMWLPFFEQVATSAELVAPELPGYGESPLSDRIQSLDDLILHCDGLLRALDVEPAHLVGHSLGGWLAADLAVYYPERFKSLTLITPMGLRLEDAPLIDPFRMTPEERLDALANGRGAELAEYFELEGELDDLIHSMLEAIPTARVSWNPRYDHRLDHRLERIKAPTLVIGAEEDRMVPTEMAARFAELIPGADLETVAGPKGQPSGHLPHLEHPTATAELVVNHINGNG